MKYRLRYQQHDFELSDGEFVIGRSSDCQLALDDALVSRRHAALKVEGDDVFIEDLGSRNGVRVNGTRIEERMRLTEGDKIRVGDQEMALLRLTRAHAETLAQPATQRADAFGLLGGLADKALALGRGEEAERILSVHMTNILDDAKRGRKIPPEMAKSASLYAVKVGAATGKGRWIDYVFDLYTATGQSLPAEVVDELYVGVRKARGVDVVRLRSYVEQTKGRVKGPAERFLLNRVEGLEPLVAPK